MVDPQQAVPEPKAQIIVAAALTQQANDKQQLVAMLDEVKKNTGEKPNQTYFKFRLLFGLQNRKRDDSRKGAKE